MSSKWSKTDICLDLLIKHGYTKKTSVSLEKCKKWGKQTLNKPVIFEGPLKGNMYTSTRFEPSYAVIFSWYTVTS